MPWKIEKSGDCPESKPWAVVKEDDGELVACHETEEAAKRQLAALNANVEESRTATVEAEGRRIVGLIPYEQRSRDLGGWTEEIARGALRDTRFDELRANIDHGFHGGLPLARFPRTLRVEHTSEGLRWSFEPPQSRQDVLEAVRRGDVTTSSWRMRVAEDRWEGDHRIVTKIGELRDVTLAGSEEAAYPSAVVEVRTRNNDAAEERQKENTMADEVRDGGLEGHEKQDEERTGPPAGSLRVEDRTAPGDMRWHSLAELFERRGFFENRVATIGWDEYRSFTWAAGTVLTDLNPIRRDGVPYGYDRRWLFPVLPTTQVDSATTAVQYLRQSARTLAGTAVIRPLDAVTTKPETSSTVEFKSQQLEQVATISKDVPRIHAAQPMFQSVIEQDLRLSVNDGLDEVVRRGVALAGTIVKGTDDILEVTRKAMTLVEAEGYAPNILAIDPAGAQSLDLLRSAGTEKFYLWGPGQGAPSGPFGLQLRVWKQVGTAVIDGNAYGRLYVAPVELRSFEQDAGQTNKQTVRMETAAAYTAERTTAARRIT